MVPGVRSDVSRWALVGPSQRVSCRELSGGMSAVIETCVAWYTRCHHEDSLACGAIIARLEHGVSAGGMLAVTTPCTTWCT